ncbi:MAG: hypothetical protein ACE5FC_03300 [Myxococcota bacterium]
MLEAVLTGLLILGIGAVLLFIATIVALAIRSTDSAGPRHFGAIDLAGTAAPRGALVESDMPDLAGSLSSLHRQLPSPAAAMDAAGR